MSFENHAVCVIMWKNIVQPERAHMTIIVIRRMRFACWIAKTTHTFRIYNTYCFSRQQWFRERVSLLRYTFIVSLVEYFLKLVRHRSL